jgi:hypothetical protein
MAAKTSRLTIDVESVLHLRLKAVAAIDKQIKKVLGF